MTNSYHALGDTLRKLNTDDLVFIKRDGSMLIFETTSVLGAQKIVEKLSKFKHQVSSLDAQPSHGNTIVVLLTGTLLVDGEQSPMNYTQCFELMPENDGYYIQNDISRLIYSY